MNTNNDVKWRRFIVPKKVEQIIDHLFIEYLSMKLNEYDHRFSGAETQEFQVHFVAQTKLTLSQRVGTIPYMMTTVIVRWDTVSRPQFANQMRPSRRSI